MTAFHEHISRLLFLGFLKGGLGMPKTKFCFREIQDHESTFCLDPLPSESWNWSPPVNTVPHTDSWMFISMILNKASLGYSNIPVRKFSSNRSRNLLGWLCHDLFSPLQVLWFFKSPWGLEDFENMKLLPVFWGHDLPKICNMQDKFCTIQRAINILCLHLQYNFIFIFLELSFNNIKVVTV